MRDWNAIDDEEFRSQVRSFFESDYPEHLRFPSHRLRWAELKDWHAKLFAKGWAPISPAALPFPPSVRARCRAV